MYSIRQAIPRPLAILVVVALLCGAGVTHALLSQPSTVRALVLNDLGGSATLIADLQAQGWNVDAASTFDLSNGGDTPYESYDVVWLPAGANHGALWRLVRDGSPLDQHVHEGGNLVIWGL